MDIREQVRATTSRLGGPLRCQPGFPESAALGSAPLSPPPLYPAGTSLPARAPAGEEGQGRGPGARLPGGAQGGRGGGRGSVCPPQPPPLLLPLLSLLPPGLRSLLKPWPQNRPSLPARTPGASAESTDRSDRCRSRSCLSLWSGGDGPGSPSPP
ncbi:hypothetical protein J1605_019318 [Eschrichtius robustus]|uniref:Uncharacterized protein n=1 Tax=Eschrichtius robustus TaxID=9764 RepID=A0AB34HPU5_ESCRO|nr:hypothetical protein J1605_019318 [Eschrichtius robustus]